MLCSAEYRGWRGVLHRQSRRFTGAGWLRPHPPDRADVLSSPRVYGIPEELGERIEHVTSLDAAIGGTTAKAPNVPLRRVKDYLNSNDEEPKGADAKGKHDQPGAFAVPQHSHKAGHAGREP
jgi:hypothetical protein